MEDLHACRFCLSTDTSLMSIHKGEIRNNICTLLGFSLTIGDGFPQHLCIYCRTMLHKYILFRRKCLISQDILNKSILEQTMVTMSYIRNIDRDAYGLTLPYVVTRPFKEISCIDKDMVKLEIVEDVSNGTKEYNGNDYDKNCELYDNDNKFDDVGPCSPNVSDDDVPLSKHIKKEDAVNVEKGQAADGGLRFCNKDFATTITLSREEQIKEVEKRKSSLNYIHSLYKCDKCFKGFINGNAFDNHMRRHSPGSGNFICDICQIRCQTDKTLRSHVITAHERKFACKQCTHVSNTSNQASEHEKWHRGYTYNCQFCGETFKKSTTHLTHVRLHHPTDFVCNMCGESFLGCHGLATHKKRMHTHHEGLTSDTETYCKECEVLFVSSEALLKHRLCSSKHNTSKVNSKCCRRCGECFEDDSQLVEHSKSHPEELVECEQCGVQFTSAKKCSAHFRRMHLGIKYPVNKNIVCEICGRKCTSKATLSYHQRTHTGEKPFQCSVCPKRFSVRQRLQIHSRTHTDERPYPCPDCPKAFRHKPALNRHARVHSGAKPYACSYCGKSFSQSNSMKLHIHTVHLKLPPPYRNKKTKSS